MSRRFTKITLIAVMAVSLAACKDDEKEASDAGGAAETGEPLEFPSDMAPQAAETDAAAGDGAGRVADAVAAALESAKAGAGELADSVADAVADTVAGTGTDTAAEPEAETEAGTGTSVAAETEADAGADTGGSSMQSVRGAAAGTAEVLHNGAEVVSGRAKEAAEATGVLVEGAVDQAVTAAGGAKDAAAAGFLRLKQGLKQSLSAPDSQ
jgi:hypothetical protein